MSTRALLYDDIVTALETLTTNGKKDINHIAKWNNQILTEKNIKAYNFPAVFVNFSTILWDADKFAGANAGASGATGQTEEQEGTMTVTLHEVFERYQGPTEAFKLNDLIIDKIYYVIQNLQGVNRGSYTPLLRREEREDDDHDRVIDHQVDFFIVKVVQAGQNSQYTQISGGVVDLGTEPLP